MSLAASMHGQSLEVLCASWCTRCPRDPYRRIGVDRYVYTRMAIGAGLDGQLPTTPCMHEPRAFGVEIMVHDSTESRGSRGDFGMSSRREWPE